MNSFNAILKFKISILFISFKIITVLLTFKQININVLMFITHKFFTIKIKMRT